MRAGVEPVCANANRVAFYIRATDLRDKNTPGYEALVERREPESTAPQKAPAIVAFGRGSSRKTLSFLPVVKKSQACVTYSMERRPSSLGSRE